MPVWKCECRRAAVEIKHFNYSRLVGGASHRLQPCDKDRWKKKHACTLAGAHTRVCTRRVGGRNHQHGLIYPGDMNWALRAAEDKGSEKYKTSAVCIYNTVILHRHGEPPLSPLAFPSNKITLATKPP